jgi:toxin FitB
MLILDTNVLSALMRRVPDRSVIGWLDRQPRKSIWTTSVTVLEIRFGLQTMPLRSRRSALINAFETLMADTIERRIAPFDRAAAQEAGDLMALRYKQGRPRELRDTMIAGIVLACHATLVTRSTSHFDDLAVTVINPWVV